MEHFEQFWKNSFNQTSSSETQDYKIAQWSKHGLERRFLFFQKAFCDYSREKEDTLILDVGCGPGIYSSFLLNNNYNVVSLDYSEKMIKVARDRMKSELSIEHKLKFILADVNNLPFKKNMFNYIICFGVLQYVEHFEKSLEEFFRIVRDNGVIIINVPNENFFLKRNEKRYKWYNPDDMIIKSSKIGFTTSHYYPLIIMPSKLIWLEKIFDRIFKYTNIFGWLAHDLFLIIKK